MMKPPRSAESHPTWARYLELTMPRGALDALMLPVLRILAQRRVGAADPLRCAGILFAGDHAVARRYGVSAYPAEVTPQMVANIVRGGAAISCLARRREASLLIVDVGVAAGFDDILNLPSQSPFFYRRENIHLLFPHEGYEQGSRDITQTAALSQQAFEHCWNVGARAAEERIRATGCDFLFLGEMGIGNTTPASVLATLLAQQPLEECVGNGTGVTHEALERKRNVIHKAHERYVNSVPCRQVTSLADAHTLLREVGGAELTALAGAAWQAAQNGCHVLMDGLIVTAALAPLALADRNFAQWLIAGHRSAEPAHKHLLQVLQVNPLLDLNLRLGEGSGAAFAAGLLQDADFLLRQMATFSSAGVSSGAAGDELKN